MTPRRNVPRISVVIPARNAASTLGETLDSLIAQSSPAWEAIIVDDDSSDETRAIADAYAARDERFRVLSSAAHSEGGARNTGIAEARAPWLLFLDADDLIDRYCLQSALYELGRASNADGVVFGWVRFSGDRVHYPQEWDDRGDHFVLAASHTPFPIHACVVRRSLVVEVGAFDASLRAAADWDLWQRIFRAGARLVRVPYTAARYRVHGRAMSRDARTMFEQSRIVLDRAYRPDPRVPRPVPAYADGAPVAGRPRALVRHLCWWTGLALATQQDPLELVEVVESDLRAALPMIVDPELVAAALAESFRQAALATDDERDLWTAAAPRIREFLAHLEHATGADRIAWRTELLLQPSPGAGERTSDRQGDAVAVDVELSEPISSVDVAADVRRALCVGRSAGRALGMVELAVSGGHMSGEDVLRAAVDKWYWELLCLDLEHRSLIPRGARGHQVWPALIGELWPQAAGRWAPIRVAGSRPVEVAIGEPLPRIVGARREIQIVVRVGPELVGPVGLSASVACRRTRLRRALPAALGADLLRAVARQALIGRTHSDLPWHARLVGRPAGQLRSTAAGRSP